MKREVKNYEEFTEAVNGLFTKAAVCDVTTYKKEIVASKQRRKQKIAAISAEVNLIKQKIAEDKEKIRQAKAEENKKEVGIRLNRLIEKKTTLIKTYQKEKNNISFQELSEEAKIYACTQSLFNKYLFAAFVQTVPNSFKINDDQSVTVDVDLFRNSTVYQQAEHIKDYVTSYLDHYPNRVQGSRYFVSLHKDATDLNELVAVADDYFDEINLKNAADGEKLLKSREGIEVVEIYPEYNAQAVRLTTAAALKYEGTEMNHCVATYTSRVEKGETEIYSIREYGDEYTELVPHATIEYQDGQVKQIKGYKDSIVDMGYINATRRFLMHLLDKKELKELINDETILQAEKKNIGIVKDTNDVSWDILGEIPEDTDIKIGKINLKAERITAFHFGKVKLEELEVRGSITAKTIRRLSEIDNVEKLNLTFNNKEKEKILDLSSLKFKEINLNFKKGADVEKIILSSNLEWITISGDMLKLSAIKTEAEIEKLKINGKFENLSSLPLKAKVIELTEGSFNNIEELDYSSFSRLTDLRFDNCNFHKLKKIKLPQTAEDVQITGGVSELSVIEQKTPLRKLRIEGDISKLKYISDVTEELELENKGKSVTKLNICMEVEKLKLKGNFDFDIFNNFSSKTKEIHFSYGTFSNVEYMDFSLFPKVTDVNFYNCVFPDLKEIIISETLENFGGSHSTYPKLERIDASDTARKKFGVLEEINLKEINYGALEDGTMIIVPFPMLASCTISFATMPNIKEIILREDVEHISLLGLHFKTVNPIDFKRYKELKELNLQFCDFPENEIIDLSANDKLEKLHVKKEHLPNIIPPQNIRTLSLRKDNDKSNAPVDLTLYQQIENFASEDIPHKEDIPASVKHMTLSLVEDEEYDIEELDLSFLKSVNINTSSHTNLPYLKKIALPESFDELLLFKVSPQLSEIDLRKCKGEVKICEHGWTDEQPKSNKGKIVLQSEQFYSIRKIRIGKATELEILKDTENMSITIEIPADMEKNKEQQLKQKYPHLKVTRAPFPPEKLLPAYIQNKGRAER